MSFSKKRNLHWLVAGLSGASLALLAGASSAIEVLVDTGVPNGFWQVEDEKEPDATGQWTSANSSSGVTTSVECSPASTTNGADGTTVIIGSNHPDGIKLKKDKGEVSQSRKESPPDVIVRTGGGSGTIIARLTCDKAEVDGSLKTKKSPNQGKFSASAKNCVCVVGDDNSQGECDGHDARLEQVATDCEGLKSVKVDVDGDTIKKIKIKGKGVASQDS